MNTEEKNIHPIKGILFACNMNSVRSPMAEAITRALMSSELKISSVGAYQGALDPFVPSVLLEEGIELNGHEPKEFTAINPEDFDLVIALTQKAADVAAQYFPESTIELWDIPNPTDIRGNREQMMDAYRAARETLKQRISQRFC